MKLCIKCKKPIPPIIDIDGKRHRLHNRKYCLICSPFEPATGKKHIKNCKKCNSLIPLYIEINGVKHSTQNRKFCLVCSPYGQHNTHDIAKQLPKTHKKCPNCKKIMTIDLFYKRRDNQDASSYCKICTGIQTKKRQRELKNKAVEYMGGKCVKCGYNKYVGALEFHHLDPKEKDPVLSRRRTVSFETLKSELDKCILVCANCHREIHHELNIEIEENADLEIEEYENV